jgi:hypothetical protein
VSSKNSDGLNIGDSIGLLSFIFAIIAFTLSPHILTKTLLLLLAAGGIVLAVKFSHWTHNLSGRTQAILTVALIVILFWLGFGQINSDLRLEGHASVASGLHRTYVWCNIQFHRRWLSDFCWAALGIFFTLITQEGSRRIRRNLIVRAEHHNANKGLLDFKQQAEIAMHQLSPTIQSITEVTIRVGCMFEKQTERIKAVGTKTTNVQLKHTRQTALKLDGYSHKLTIRTSKLERVGLSLQEGLLGLVRISKLKGANQSELRMLAPSLRSLCVSITTAVEKTDQFIAMLSLGKAYSRDLDIALDRHITEVSRVRDASLLVRNSCLQALEMMADL